MLKYCASGSALSPARSRAPSRSRSRARSCSLSPARRRVATGIASQKTLLSEMERQVGHPIRRRVVGRMGLRVLGMFMPIMRELGEMHYLETDPVLMDDSALEELIGPIKRTGYVEAIRQTLAAAKVA